MSTDSRFAIKERDDLRHRVRRALDRIEKLEAALEWIIDVPYGPDVALAETMRAKAREALART